MKAARIAVSDIHRPSASAADKATPQRTAAIATAARQAARIMTHLHGTNCDGGYRIVLSGYLLVAGDIHRWPPVFGTWLSMYLSWERLYFSGSPAVGSFWHAESATA